ncbi:MAG: AAA family ATPase, partial [Bacteroidaceae bacterium]|nr:AAA family ATPase [Bacteroidaceae bacterium]
HPDVFNILLQVLDDGRLTDNKGRVVNFKNTIIIMTSNMGSAYIQEQFEKMNDTNREYIMEETKEKIMDMLKKNIRPEFLNRIDETIMFTPLNESEIEQIVRLQISAITAILKESEVELHVTDAAVKFISQAGFDPEFGARPIKRAIQRLLLNDLSKQLLAGAIDKMKPVTVDADDKMLLFSNR